MKGNLSGRTPRGPRAVALLAPVLAVVLALSACSGDQQSGAVTLTWYASNESGGPFQAIAETCSQQSGGAYDIRVELLPKDADQQRELLVRRLAAGDPSVDLMVMDVIWVPEFASARWVADWPTDVAQQATEGRLPTAIQSATFEGRLWAAPLTGNAQMLWYREDLVPQPPETWDQMLDQAAQLGPNGVIYSQGARYEGLTAFFNSLLESAGGKILSDDGKQVSLEEGPTKRALELMRRYAGGPAAPAGLSTAKEDDARLGFESGTGAFQLNYGFVYASAQKKKPDLAANMGTARWPGVTPGQPSKVTYGGFNLGVGAFSRHRQQAFAAAACLSDEAQQKAITMKAGLPPTAASLYDDPEVEKELPFGDVLRDSLAGASLRPLTHAYNDISLSIQRTLHPMSDIDPERDYPRLRDAVDRAINSRGLI
jgi:multiple sugar transport system substrate-binding protein